MNNKIKDELKGKLYEKKRDNYQLIESYFRLGWEDKAEKIISCATSLDYRFPIDDPEDVKLHRANFCKDRLCNICAWRRSMKIFGQVSEVMDELEKKYAFIFITLTVRNCSADDLSETITILQNGFKHMMQSSQAKAFKGYFKALEITHNFNNPKNLQYHPHLHAIVAVNKSYFHDTKNYVSLDKLIAIWRDKCKLDYDPSVDIHKVKPQPDEKGDFSIKKAVCEAAKYTIKTQDIAKGSFVEIDRAVKAYSTSLRNRRVCSFGGVFKEAATHLKLDDMIDGDLVHTDNQKMRSDVEYTVITYHWKIGFGYAEAGSHSIKPKRTKGHDS